MEGYFPDTSPRICHQHVNSQHSKLSTKPWIDTCIHSSDILADEAQIAAEGRFPERGWAVALRRKYEACGQANPWPSRCLVFQ
ncbi:hypothetical protein BJX99DRAFT_225578 [Aspergillus californicus]